MSLTDTTHPPPAPSLADAPRFDMDGAARLARKLYGVDARASPLPSERDQNFLIEPAAGEPIVLKIAMAGENRSILEAQQAALHHLAPSIDLCARVIPTLGGATLAEATGLDGRTHLVWAVSHLPGITLASEQRRSPELLEDFGQRIAALRCALSGFDHPAIHRDFYWDLASARRIVSQHRSSIEDVALGAAIDTLVARFDLSTAPLLRSLPRSAIHNDLNDHNVLVGGGADLWRRNQRVVGIIDFGDMVHSYAVADLAIAAAYVMLDANDSLGAAAALVRGHQREHRLTDTEIGALFGLIALRLCASACIAADQLRQRPDDDYLAVSQAAIRRALPVLAGIPFGLAEAVFREAAGLEPFPASVMVREWLGAHTADFAPVLDADLRREASIVLDLGVGSPMVGGDDRENAEPELTRRIFGTMRDAGVRVAVGRYDEPRLLYTSSVFASGGGVLEERRAIHLGLDLFADAGTPVHAPVAGVVHAVADNHAPLDYGPLIILRHATEDGAQFFTLYGHLSRESLAGLRVGQPVRRGQQIATIGTPDVNVGWTPHVHLQVITDLLGMGTDFPGVGRASQRAVWRSLSPDPNLIVGVPADRFPAAEPAKGSTLADRHRLLGGNLSIAYREPLKIVRGWKQYLFDDEARRYLDAYNNVPHVGHAHPRVVRAAANQMAMLNTNTRYLSDIVTEYAARLTATLPEPLAVCYLVNSASEANELAVRLARAYTGQRDMIVLEAAYHGNTTTLIDLSPYKHGGPGGAGPPDWVHVAPIADDYRGRYKRNDVAAGPGYARHVAALTEAVNAKGRGLAGFIAETCPSVGGQIVFPAGYLAEAYRHVREAGGVCIADEVQTGLGRMGTHFWAFEAQDVVPDVVVMGKPLGNGHPIGAVVTTREIAAAFDNGMEFFSTFGGNTVSCAVGLAVLDVLRDEGLQAHALEVGERMLEGLWALHERLEIVGDVRGSGLFLGVELVRDRTTLEPATEEASYAANRMREQGILLGTDGPYHNVIKIRPPMPFTASDGELLVEMLGRTLGELSPKPA